MKLTRKHLNIVLCQLPHPSLVLAGKVAPFFKVPIYKATHVIIEDYDPRNMTQDIHELTFEFSHEEMDWVLYELNV